MKLIKFKNKDYPGFQAEGNASQFAIPYAKHFCFGNGIDIGCNKAEWAFPGAKLVDISFNDGYDAFNLPNSGYDYIFSSHCLEHLNDWVLALDYWIDSIVDGGTLFLYLPDISQEYWHPWNNYKHKNVFTPEIIKSYMENKGLKNIFVSGVDLNNSFIAVGEK